MDSDSDRQPVSPPPGSRPPAGASAPTRWGVAQRLWLGFGTLIALLFLTDLVSYRYTLRIANDLRQIVAVEEPLEEAVLEMEINAGETARAVLSYVGHAGPELLEKLHDSEADFERFAAEYHELAETPEERRLGRKVAEHYGVFKSLGDEIVSLAQTRNATLASFRQNILEIDALIDDKIQAAIDRGAPQGAAKIEATFGMEVNIFEAFTAILAYVAGPNPELREEVGDAEADFQAYAASYRRQALSEEEAGWLDEINMDFAKAVAAGNRILTATDRLKDRVERFEQGLETIDALLDDRIQPLIDAETARAAADAEGSIDQANILLLLLATAGLLLGAGAAWASSRDILVPLRSLTRGAEIVGAGTLTHRIEVRTRNEFAGLAAALNRMVANLARGQSDLADGRGRLQSILDTAADGIVTIDGEARITSFNRTAEAMFGFSADEVMGRNVKMLMPAPYHGEHDGYLARYRESGEKRIIGIGREVVGQRQDGTTFPLDLAVSEFQRGDEVVYTGLLRDITERKRAEEAVKTLNAELEQRVEARTAELRAAQEELLRKSRLAALGQLTGTVSHELRNPLGALRTSIAAIRKLSPDPAPMMRRSIEIANRSVTRCDEIITDLLEYSRVRPLNLTEVALDDWLPAVLDETDPPEGVEVTRNLDCGLDLPIDSDRLRRAIVNVFENACQAMTVEAEDDGDGESRDARLSVATRVTEARVELRVADTGPGMDAETMGRIFEPLYSTKAFGVGLGMTVVQQIMEQHGGGVEIASTPGAGTEVVLWLPLPEPARRAAS